MTPDLIFYPVKKQMDFMLLSYTLKMVIAINFVLHIFVVTFKKQMKSEVFRRCFGFFLIARRQESNTVE